jgi:lipopolysaccharide/colanic/teichoic acid biosynthesis glycosyltransferase
MATKLAHIREATIGIELGYHSQTDGIYRAAKRALDVLLAIVLLIVLAPILLAISCAIALDSPGPVIFRQKRVLGGQPLGTRKPQEKVFEFFKFRSMYHNADQRPHQQYMQALIKGDGQVHEAEGQRLYKLGYDPRVTRVGAILRKTSLDELPQLVNILKGQMSFVGPRPAIPYEVEAYKPWHLRRLTVPQGLTGLWQIRGRNELTFDEMVQLDVEYARERSLGTDLAILFSTIPTVLSRRGAR